MRLQLTDGDWKLGLFDDRSYASSYGEDGDIYIAEQYFIRPDGFPLLDKTGEYRATGDGLLIRWLEVKYVDFTPWLGKKKKRRLAWRKKGTPAEAAQKADPTDPKTGLATRKKAATQGGEGQRATLLFRRASPSILRSSRPRQSRPRRRSSHPRRQQSDAT
jgi:hypothetical protein